MPSSHHAIGEVELIPEDVRADTFCNSWQESIVEDSRSVSYQNTTLKNQIFGLEHDHTYTKASKTQKNANSNSKKSKSHKSKNTVLKGRHKNTSNQNKSLQRNLKILFLNVGGLRTKLRASDFFRKNGRVRYCLLGGG